MKREQITGSASFKKLNPGLFAPDHINETAVSLLEQHQNMTRIRQSHAGLNKLEQAFLAAHPAFLPQAIKFKIGNGVWYTPDFIDTRAFRLRAYEVKGPFFRDDAIVKLKVVASTHRYVDFFLVWRENGNWRLQAILP